MHPAPIKYFVIRFAGLFAALLFLILAAVACNTTGADGDLNLGRTIPENEPVVRLVSLLENPDGYNDRAVVVKGVVSSQCPSFCHFIFQDGIHSVAIFPRGFDLPKLERGRAVTLYVQVISGEERVVFSALGLKI